MTQPRRVGPLIGALWLAEIASSFETAMILAALKVLVAEFGDAATVGWLVTGFLICGAAVAALVGRLGDLFGRRRILLVVLAIGTAGSLVSAASSSFAVLLAGRTLQGVTGAVMALCVGLVRENLARDRAPAAIGLMISGASIGTALGLVVGGLIVDLFSWHGVFVASAAFCLVAMLAVRALVPPSPAGVARGPTDWLSGLLFAPGVTLILVYVSVGKTWGWGDGAALAILAAGVALTVWWAWRSWRSPNPLIAVRSFADRTVAIGGAVTALVAMSTLQITIFFSLLLQAPRWTAAGLGLSATAAGLAKLPSNLTSVLAAPLGGWLAGRGGGRLAMIAGGLVTALGWGLVLVDAGSVAIVVAELILISFGATMLFAVAPTIIAQAAPSDRVSEVSGLLTVIRQLFLGIGAQLVATLLTVAQVTRAAETYPAPAAYRLVVIVIIALCGVAILVSCALPGRAILTPPEPAPQPA